MPPYVPLEQRQRIVELSLQGWSQRAICRLMNRLRAAVSRIIRTYRDHGGSLADRERSGRPRATDTQTNSLIVACVVVDPFIDGKEIRRELQLDVSLSTIRRRLREAGLRGCSETSVDGATEAAKARVCAFCGGLHGGRMERSNFHRRIYLLFAMGPAASCMAPYELQVRFTCRFDSWQLTN